MPKRDRSFERCYGPVVEGDCLFERNHHNRIANVLLVLDADVLSHHQCWFGGGTAIVLRRGEYRESLDIDFLVSHLESYQRLRAALTSGSGLGPIVRKGQTLKLSSDLRVDQYGIRTLINAGGVDIKFEIVFEARIELTYPKREDLICSVPCLTLVDMAASKLLANSDRWNDPSVFSRDLIDLAMLDLKRSELKSAIDKASLAYGESVRRDLNRSIQMLRDEPRRLEVCMSRLKMEGIPKALLWKKIKRLSVHQP